MASTAKRKTSPASFLLKLREVLAREDPAVISWDGDGKITIGDPKRLGDEVLTRYFRHGNFSSFQRQLNNFGFKKIEGKGKLTPCMYVAMPFMRSMPRGIVCIACGLVTNEPRFFFLQCYSFASQLWTRRATRAGASVCVIGSP